VTTSTEKTGKKKVKPENTRVCVRRNQEADRNSAGNNELNCQPKMGDGEASTSKHPEPQKSLHEAQRDKNQPVRGSATATRLFQRGGQKRGTQIKQKKNQPLGKPGPLTQSNSSERETRKKLLRVRRRVKRNKKTSVLAATQLSPERRLRACREKKKKLGGGPEIIERERAQL